ncbi:phytanoyl-CoA dioxygenase family protein [Paenibacillus montanisoli]|uniref:Phytanoyl-CoA dioxygenase n=1 Tax=Paenibacillus montanisoli TaxID=2081970 RepID=A0A328TZN2_9BACL|nr:phytanoyl-CoA dioxygenase family protein [Paenibacillus montanisoli]RAP74983.1 hypothetical protein DL346_16430 [Paenibacillus montanisoli]
MSLTLQEQVEQFKRDGFLVIKQALSPERVSHLIDKVIEISQGFTTREIPDIIDRDEAFAPILVNPPVFNVMRALMGPRLQMESVNATRVKPGQGMPVGWHMDSHVYPDPLPPYWYFPISINCAYYLDDITPEKGPLVVVPGSHLFGKNPPEGLDEIEGQIDVFVEAGDAVIFHGALWHAAKPNVHPTEERRALYYNHLQSFCKQRVDNFAGERCRLLRESGPFYIQQMLGKFDGWHEIPADAEEQLANI